MKTVRKRPMGFAEKDTFGRNHFFFFFGDENTLTFQCVASA